MRITSKLCYIKWGKQHVSKKGFRFIWGDKHSGFSSLFINDVEIRIFKKGKNCTPFIPGERKRAFWRAIFKVYYQIKYYEQDSEICCCGERIGHGGSICHHGGCRSYKDYIIEHATEYMVNKLAPYPV